MLTLMRNRWRTWARAWALTHHARRGLLQPTEAVTGARDGLLLRVGWGDSQFPGLTVTIRFPRAVDVQQLRDRLAADASLDALPGRAGVRRGIKVAASLQPSLRWSKPPEVALAENCLVWRRTFAWGFPRTVRLMAWVDTLVAAVARATPGFEGRCEGCGVTNVQRHVLVDGMPMLLCATCQQRSLSEGEMAERAYEMTEASHGVGAALAGLAALVGATGWAAVSALSQRQFAAAAIGIGALVAWAYRRGAGRVDGLGRGLAALFTLASVTLGDILLFAGWVAKARPDVGFRLDAGALVYLSAWSERPADQLITLLFAGVGAWFAFRALEGPKLKRTIVPADAPGDEDQRAA
jgi:hypothetical protein